MSAGQRLNDSPRRVDLDRVEELAAERFDAGDVPAPCWHELLHQRRVIDTEIELVGLRPLSASTSRFEEYFTMPAPLPPMFAFTTIGKRKPSARFHRLRRVIDDPRLAGTRVSSDSRSVSWRAFGKSPSQKPFEPVHDRNAEAFEVRHVARP